MRQETRRGYCLVQAALVLLASFVLCAGASMPHVADCMKNPFASVCRGISAKRSVGERAPNEWPPEEQFGAAWPAQRSTSPAPLSNKQLGPVAAAIELLLASAAPQLARELALGARRTNFGALVREAAAEQRQAPD